MLGVEMQHATQNSMQLNTTKVGTHIWPYQALELTFGMCKLLIADMKKCQHPVSGDESHYHFSWKEYFKFCC
jgi:hypothetical protein